MARHRSARRISLGLVTVVAVAAVLVVSTLVALVVREQDGEPAAPAGTDPAAAAGCDRSLRVVTSSSFAPVLGELAPGLTRAADCLRLDLLVADGRTAAAEVARSGADVWIPDDAAWAGFAAPGLLAPTGRAGSGRVLAASPVYLVAEPATAERVERAGGSWLGLTELLTTRSGIRAVLREPAGSADGMVAAGALGEAVWLDRGMDASALALATAIRSVRTVPSADPALPARPGEVGLVPEYALLPALGQDGARLRVLAGADHTAVLRFTWLPTAAAVRSPARSAAAGQLLAALTGDPARAALDAARLRRSVSRPPGVSGPVPNPSAPPFDVLEPHHVDHVFATWYPADRRTAALLVVDVSGSMAATAPGTSAPLIELVRRGCRNVAGLLPAGSSLGLWEFGSRLDGARDHRVLLAPGPLGRRRGQLAQAVAALAPRTTGTGLHDTILAGYVAARDGYRAGIPNQVLVFTDGRNEDDPGSISAGRLATALAAARDPERPVLLTIAAFGGRPQAEVLERAVEPVDGYVATIDSPQEVSAAFVHVAAGGLHAH